MPVACQTSSGGARKLSPGGNDDFAVFTAPLTRGNNQAASARSIEDHVDGPRGDRPQAPTCSVSVPPHDPNVPLLHPPSCPSGLNVSVCLPGDTGPRSSNPVVSAMNSVRRTGFPSMKMCSLALEHAPRLNSNSIFKAPFVVNVS